MTSLVWIDIQESCLSKTASNEAREGNGSKECENSIPSAVGRSEPTLPPSDANPCQRGCLGLASM
jgi:hypothetical protein